MTPATPGTPDKTPAPEPAIPAPDGTKRTLKGETSTGRRKAIQAQTEATREAESKKNYAKQGGSDTWYPTRTGGYSADPNYKVVDENGKVLMTAGEVIAYNKRQKGKRKPKGGVDQTQIMPGSPRSVQNASDQVEAQVRQQKKDQENKDLEARRVDAKKTVDSHLKKGITTLSNYELVTAEQTAQTVINSPWDDKEKASARDLQKRIADERTRRSGA